MDREFSQWAILVDPPASPHGPALAEWIARGHHAGMDYMERTAARRCSVAEGYPGYRTVVIALLPHDPDAFAGAGSRDLSEIARYAVGEDYHLRFDKGFERVLAEVAPVLPAGERPLIKPDHGALLEKSLAQMAGLGKMGKNTLLINGRLGSWFTIGCLLLRTPLVPVIRSAGLREDPCGSCSRCLTECPTEAFSAPYSLDAGRCLSYLTIERPGDPRASLRQELGGQWLFGCDRCQEVCPHNSRDAGQYGGLSGQDAGEAGRFYPLHDDAVEKVEALRRRHSALNRVPAEVLVARLGEISGRTSGLRPSTGSLRR